jgi:hypothetical protein
MAASPILERHFTGFADRERGRANAVTSTISQIIQRDEMWPDRGASPHSRHMKKTLTRSRLSPPPASLYRKRLKGAMSGSEDGRESATQGC